ncbi:MAG: choice-of-anchor I family protein [Planctomycetales bacterium]|nr:choice-of-anchor I family protein [Planctomycetales bacterium]
MTVELTSAGTYATNLFDAGAAEIVDYYNGQVFVTNGDSSSVDVLDASDIGHPTLVNSLPAADDTTAYLGRAFDSPTSVAVNAQGLIAVAVPADPKTDPGAVAFYSSAGTFLGAVTVGALPDSVIFTPDGKTVLSANEGEPSDDYTVDPEGSVGIISVHTTLTDENVDSATVRIANFNRYDGQKNRLLDEGVRIYGPGASVSQDLEPEYLTVSDDSRTAWVTLQENNALGVINLRTGRVTDIIPLGYKDHSLRGNGFDASDADGAINIRRWPVLGMYQPDHIANYTVDGKTYLVTANEGDARDYEGYSELARVNSLRLWGKNYGNMRPGQLVKDENLGRLNVTTAFPTTTRGNRGAVEQLYSYGARSFSIWDVHGRQVFDSGDQIERLVAQYYPDDFNSTDDANGSFDNRSDDKGPEPEAVVVGEVDGRMLAFVGLERAGGIMVFDVTNPRDVEFQSYVNTRDFTGDPAASTAGDLAPEGLKFIPADASPTGEPLLVVAYEVSGSTTIFRVTSSAPMIAAAAMPTPDFDDAAAPRRTVNLTTLVDVEKIDNGQAVSPRLDVTAPTAARRVAKLLSPIPSVARSMVARELSYVDQFFAMGVSDML